MEEFWDHLKYETQTSDRPSLVVTAAVHHPDSTNRPDVACAHFRRAHLRRPATHDGTSTRFNERDTPVPFPRISRSHLGPPSHRRPNQRPPAFPAGRPPKAGGHDAALLAVRFRRATPVGIVPCAPLKHAGLLEMKRCRPFLPAGVDGWRGSGSGGRPAGNAGSMRWHGGTRNAFHL
ncbi:hypothetical protein HU200_055084 [Digitaria exilis]|uniref:Uncharacterized protein n=1 Tax=Digitaria exilis TaxID=1010633 RepID=A0A835ATJ6_9POAL|nr:hypothetical protein HU200_055084 [Digitaria exilis]